MAKHRAIEDNHIHSVQTGWTEAFLICRKCTRKLDGGFGPDRRDTLRKAMRVALRSSGQRGQIGLMEVGCFGVCPKRAVTVVRASQPGNLLIAPVGTAPEQLLR